MKQSTQGLARRAIYVLVIMTMGCRSATDAGSGSSAVGQNPAPRPDELRIAPRPLMSGCLQPGQTLSPGPAVVVSDVRGRAVSGVTVEFRAGSDGQIDHATAVTGADGVASAGTWRLGDKAGIYSVVASIAGGPSTTITVSTSAAARVVAVYDLISIGGKLLPVTSPGGASVYGGHYVLAENGTYLFRYDASGESFSPPAILCSTAKYVAGVAAIDFYLAPGTYPMSSFYQDRSGHFATATLSGETMSVKYDDFVDFEDEVYEFTGGSPSLGDSRAVSGAPPHMSHRVFPRDPRGQ